MPFLTEMSKEQCPVLVKEQANDNPGARGKKYHKKERGAEKKSTHLDFQEHDQN